MKSHWITGGALAVGILLVGVQASYARTEITCLFSWPENPEANVKGHSKRVATMKKVSTKEYERLVGKKIAARVTGSGGANCTLRHPDNMSIELEIRKDEFRLDPAGAIPSCEALQATVECEGKEKPESSPEN